MATAPNIRLSLLGRPENVLVVRQALSGLAAWLGLDAIEANDLNTAVTEACNNVVMHAYEGAEGALELEVYALAASVLVLVRDHGIGIDERELDNDIGEGNGTAGGGMGLAIIAALAREAEFVEPPGGGTEVRMEFPAPAGSSLQPVDDAQPADDLDSQTAGAALAPEEDRRNAVELCIAPPALARPILPRVLSTLAARAHFTTDRIADVQVVADVLASNAGESIDGTHLAVGVTISPRRLDLRIGPLHDERGESLIATAADGLAPVVERLTDSKRVESAGSRKILELGLVDQRS